MDIKSFKSFPGAANVQQNLRATVLKHQIGGRRGAPVSCLKTNGQSQLGKSQADILNLTLSDCDKLVGILIQASSYRFFGPYTSLSFCFYILWASTSFPKLRLVLLPGAGLLSWPIFYAALSAISLPVPFLQ